MIKAIFKLIRVKHYTKNILIFLPIFFSGKVFEISVLNRVIWGFISFCLMASVVYIINDMIDLEKDRQHEIKRERPLAKGTISLPFASFLAVILLLLSLLTNWLYNNESGSWLILVIYWLINIAYSAGLKNIPLLDILIIVAGFMLRVLLGGVLIDVEISHWMYLTVLSMSFFLALGKRRNEIIKVGNSARNVLKHYTIDFLDKVMYMCLSLTIVFYSLWSLAPNPTVTSNYLIWTVPLVLIITMKYSMIIEGDSYGDPADVLFSDKGMLALVSLYGLSLIAIIYFGNS